MIALTSHTYGLTCCLPLPRYFGFAKYEKLQKLPKISIFTTLGYCYIPSKTDLFCSFTAPHEDINGLPRNSVAKKKKKKKQKRVAKGKFQIKSGDS